jgi:arylsulfatase
MIQFINEHIADENPFFGYLAYTAPHNPLHAPQKYIDKYKGKYDGGWDDLRKKRLERLKSLGLVPLSMVDHPRQEWTKAWSELTDDQQRNRARDMEIYAAMIDYLDESIGHLFDYLKKIGEYDNTLIIFFSDNGASKTTIEDYAGIGGDMDDFIESFDNNTNNRGLPGSYTSIGPGWAYAANTPFRLMKGYLAQGGIQVPSIMKLPGKMNKGGSRTDAFTYVIDIMPTILEAANAEHSEEYMGKSVLPMQGKSLIGLLSGRADETFSERAQGFELYGMRAFRKENWKALKLPSPYGSGAWELYNLNDDPAETDNLATENELMLKQFETSWENYARENGVIEPKGPVSYAKKPKHDSW